MKKRGADTRIEVRARTGALIETEQRLNILIEECRRDPFRGIGKPEPLRESLKGWWSRRINGEDRLVYRVAGQGNDQRLEIIQCRLHY